MYCWTNAVFTFILKYFFSFRAPKMMSSPFNKADFVTPITRWTRGHFKFRQVHFVSSDCHSLWFSMIEFVPLTGTMNIHAYTCEVRQVEKRQKSESVKNIKSKSFLRSTLERVYGIVLYRKCDNAPRFSKILKTAKKPKNWLSFHSFSHVLSCRGLILKELNGGRYKTWTCDLCHVKAAL